jgi:hypothetical protein
MRGSFGQQKEWKQRGIVANYVPHQYCILLFSLSSLFSCAREFRGNGDTFGGGLGVGLGGDKQKKENTKQFIWWMENRSFPSIPLFPLCWFCIVFTLFNFLFVI